MDFDSNLHLFLLNLKRETSLAQCFRLLAIAVKKSTEAEFDDELDSVFAFLAGGPFFELEPALLAIYLTYTCWFVHVACFRVLNYIPDVKKCALCFVTI